MMMSRLFHARIRWQSWLYLMLILFVAVYAAWNQHPLWMTVSFIGLVLVIERIVHTSYRITDTHLIVHTTRFRADTVIPIADIARIDRVRGLRVLGRDFNSALLIVYQSCQGVGQPMRELALMPQNETDFVDYLTKKRQRLERSASEEGDDEDED